MNKLLTTLCIAALAPIGGCAYLQNLTPADVTQVIDMIQQDCETACGVIPSTLTAGALITAAGLPTVSVALADASAISEAICAAIGPAPTPASGKFHMKMDRKGVMRKVWTPNDTPVMINGHQVVVHFL